MVVGPWFHGTEYAGSSNWAACVFPWKVISLSGPITIVCSNTGKYLGDSIACVCEDADLEPLGDDDDGLARTTEKDKPIAKPKSTKVRKPVTEAHSS
ncbi:hypothetical protein [Variovorax sp. dw_308]|uniref:hypothetical protein n=1 Tax=Variovorax sp. dw_308 TaxID=2721546 RepID=UPI001C4650FB|nr:hypothetical protein [Variovorax sp. dw_308]